jgi:2-polyprenyl-3-methyl-5-hydroxy-6-metoxy-1,4-benzoquinol methylase
MNEHARRVTSGQSVACRVCTADTEFELTATDRNRAVDGCSFSYRRCPDCATIQLAAVPADLERYYPGDYHGVPTSGQLRERVGLELHKIELLRRHVEVGRLVEIGPSYGAFACAAREAGFDVTGVEMDGACCAYLEQTIGVRAIRSAAPEEVLASLPPSRVIVMWHVLEHLAYPLRVLEAASANLEPGGLLAIGVPNPASLGFRLMGRRWAHLDAPRHLTLVPLATLAERAAALGLEPVATVFDDPFAQNCNRFAWEYAMRRRPSTGPSSMPIVRASQVIEKLMAPIERTGMRSAAYTLLLRQPGSGSQVRGH